MPACFLHTIYILKTRICWPELMGLLNWRLKCGLPVSTNGCCCGLPKTYSHRKKVVSGLWARHSPTQGVPTEALWLLFLNTHRVIFNSSVGLRIITTLLLCSGWARNYTQVVMFCRLLLKIQSSKFIHWWVPLKRYILFPWGFTKTVIPKACLDQQHQH